MHANMKATKKETPAEEVSITTVPSAEVPGKTVPYSQAQIDLIKRTVAKGATNDELKLFLVIANRTGLDPFSRQIYFVKRKSWQGEVGVTQTGIDGYRAIAERSGELAGMEDIVYDTEEAKHPNKATAKIYRIIKGVRVPFIATARWNEYIPKAPNDFMWHKMPYLMLGKVAEALALRKAFPNDLSGLYTEEESQSIGSVVVEASTVTVAPDTAPVEVVEKPNTAQDNLFAAAREFGAKQGEEAIFIQEQLGIDIDWDAMDDKSYARLRTQLNSHLTPR